MPALTTVEPRHSAPRRQHIPVGAGLSPALGSGANWCTAQISQGTSNISSRFSYEGTVSSTDEDRVTDSREKGRIGIFGTTQSYAGSSGRVTHELIGRDLNPLGRGDGNAYVAGALNLGRIGPRLPYSRSTGGSGNSVNNCGQYCGYETLPSDPGFDHPGQSGDSNDDWNPFKDWQIDDLPERPDPPIGHGGIEIDFPSPGDEDFDPDPHFEVGPFIPRPGGDMPEEVWDALRRKLEGKETISDFITLHDYRENLMTGTRGLEARAQRQRELEEHYRRSQEARMIKRVTCCQSINPGLGRCPHPFRANPECPQVGAYYTWPTPEQFCVMHVKNSRSKCGQSLAWCIVLCLINAGVSLASGIWAIILRLLLAIIQVDWKDLLEVGLIEKWQEILRQAGLSGTDLWKVLAAITKALALADLAKCFACCAAAHQRCLHFANSEFCNDPVSGRRISWAHC